MLYLHFYFYALENYRKNLGSTQPWYPFLDGAPESRRLFVILLDPRVTIYAIPGTSWNVINGGRFALQVPSFETDEE